MFVASLSESVLLEVYSDFINNFTEAMDLAKWESKRKSGFANLLKVSIFYLPINFSSLFIRESWQKLRLQKVNCGRHV